MHEQREMLIARAIHARKRAYVPYSNFAVGAALLLNDGRVVEGCNVENASYGLTNCAERTALFRTIAEIDHFDKHIVCALAVVANSPTPVSPCGACRQVLVELCPPKMPVYLANMQGEKRTSTVAQLLPDFFEAANIPSIGNEQGGN